jgi:hypothetical protein
LRYQRDGFVVDALLERGKPLPDWVLDEPVLEQFEDFYIRAFYCLITERRGGVCIPHSEIVTFGERSGLSSAMIGTFTTIIWTLETAYNTWAKGEQDKHSAQSKPSPAKRLKSGTFSSK